jgi:hypothetical protein
MSSPSVILIIPFIGPIVYLLCVVFVLFLIDFFRIRYTLKNGHQKSLIDKLSPL